MTTLHTRLSTLAALGTAVLLAACATPPAPAPGAQATQTAEQARKPERRTTTGSRIPASDSTQIVRTISGSSANETMRSQPNPGKPGN